MTLCRRVGQYPTLRRLGRESMESKFLMPRKGFVLLVDGSNEQVECGVVVARGTSASYMDYVVAKTGKDDNLGFGQGDRVILADPFAGRRVMLDGAPYRIVRVEDIIAVLEG